MLTAAGSPLVAGSVAPAQNTMAKKVKAIRMFMWDGKVRQIGEIVEVSDTGAHEVVSSHKAQYVTVSEPAPAAPETNAPKGRGSKKDAG